MHKKRDFFNTYVLPIITMVGFLVLWEIATRIFNIQGWLLPAPSEVFLALVQRPDLLGHTWATLYETLMGFILAIAIGVPIAVAVVYSPVLRSAIYPIILITQSIPKVAFAPILLIWIGYGGTSIIVIAFLVSFWPVIVNTATGLNSPSPELLDLARQLSANQFQIYSKIRFPASLPYFLSGLKVAITLSVIGAVIGEFVGADKGLGYLVISATSQFRTDVAFAAMAILSALGIGLFAIIASLEKVLIPWYGRS
jgi:NitT/TauT family transport system permease protein